jgi:cell division protein FtsQ
VTATRIDPRIRERRVAVARAAGRKRLRVIAVVATTVVVFGLAYLLVTSPLLDVDNVQVAGVDGAAAQQVRSAARVPLHHALLFLDTAAIARRVEAIAWVAHASVKREYPGTVRIVVTEWKPTAYIRVPGHGVLLVASTGRVYARAAKQPLHVREIRGVRFPPSAGDALAPVGVADIASRLPVALARRVRAIDISSGVALVLSNGGTIRLGNEDDLDAKAAAAVAVLARVGPAPFAYLDVSTPQTPVFRR